VAHARHSSLSRTPMLQAFRALSQPQAWAPPGSSPSHPQPNHKETSIRPGLPRTSCCPFLSSCVPGRRQEESNKETCDPIPFREQRESGGQQSAHRWPEPNIRTQLSRAQPPYLLSQHTRGRGSRTASSRPAGLLGRHCVTQWGRRGSGALPSLAM
jgi:hypothetical protein